MILKIVDQNKDERIIDLDDMALDVQTSIGREDSCDIVIPDKKSSRIHVYLYKKDGHIIIEDNNSSNGTVKNGNKITKEKMSVNESFQIGNTMFYLLDKEDKDKKIDDLICCNLSITDEANDLVNENMIVKDSSQVDIRNYLHKLYEISNNVITNLDINIVLNLAMESIFEALNIDRGFILLYNDKKELVPSIVKNKFNEISDISISKTVIKLAANEKKVILSNNTLADPRFNQAQSIADNSIRSLMCAPLFVKDEVFGIVQVDTRDLSVSFTESDLELFCGIANQIAIGIYNARLYSDVKKLMNYNESILSNMGSGVLVFDVNFALTKMNDIAKKILELEEDFLNKTCLELSDEKDFFNNLLDCCKKDKYHKLMEYEFIKNGEISSIQMNIIPFFNSEKQKEGVIVSFIDITEIKKLKEEIRRKKQLAALGEMASFLAHEIRNPLNSIKGFTQILSKKITEETSKKHFGIIVDEVDRINNIVSDLLTFARYKDLAKEEVPFHEYLDGILVQLEIEIKNKNAVIDKQYSENVGKVLIDRNQLRQVFLNIIQNALMAVCDVEGKITIITKIEEKKLKIEIKDNGSGIKNDIINKIFEPFFTNKENGTGLGLAISKKIVEQHKGIIKVESQENEGTSFFIEIPV